MMILPSDKDYKETKLIKEGKGQMNPDFRLLAQWINDNFNVLVLNILHDTIDKNKDSPRLTIIFEYQEDGSKFRNNLTGYYDKEKQKIIASKFRELVDSKVKRDTFISKLFHTNSASKYNSKNLFVVFTSFEPIAKIEANEKIPESRVEELKEKINNADIWKIYRQFSGTIFFFYTEEQIEKYSKDGTNEYLSKMYFELLNQYNEFGYFKKETFSITLDSKENFDKNYNSNWFYYSR